MIMVFSFAERPVVLALRHRSVLAGVVVRVIGDVQLPVAPGVHLLPLQAALAEQVPADGTRGRGFQPGPARTAPMGKGQVPGTCAASIPEPVVLLTAVAPHRGQLRGRVEHELLGFVCYLGGQQYPGAGLRLLYMLPL